MLIHSQAIIDPGAKIGDNVTVGPFSYIGPDVEIGNGCVIGPHVVIHPFTRIMSGCRIHAGAVLGDEPQDVAFSRCRSFVEIGGDCTIREGVTVHRGTKEDSITRIGARCYLMVNSHVAHNCVLGDDVILANGVLLGGYVEIGDRAFLSGNAVVHQFCKVGRLAMLSGLSAASKDVPPFCTLLNNATNMVAGLNIVGLRRAGINPGERQQVKKSFQLLYRHNMNVGQAVDVMKKEFPSGPAAELWQFVEASSRGICSMNTEHSAAQEE